MRQRALTVRDLFFFALGAFSASYLSLRATPDNYAPYSSEREAFLDFSIASSTQDVAASVQPSAPSVHGLENSFRSDAKPKLTLPSALLPFNAIYSESLPVPASPISCPVPPPCPTLPLQFPNDTFSVPGAGDLKPARLPESSLWLLIGVNTVARSGGEAYLAQVNFKSEKDDAPYIRW